MLTNNNKANANHDIYTSHNSKKTNYDTTKVNNAENLSCAPAYYNDDFPNETSINSILNPEANCFLPLYRGGTAKINDIMVPMSEPYNFNVACDHGYDIPPFVSRHTILHTTSILNPHAGIFVTSCIRTFENCAFAMEFSPSIEAFVIEIKLKKKKWLLIC